MASRTRPRQLAAIFTNQQDTGGDRRLAGRNGRSATPTKTAEAGRRSRAGPLRGWRARIEGWASVSAMVCDTSYRPSRARRTMAHRWPPGAGRWYRRPTMGPARLLLPALLLLGCAQSPPPAPPQAPLRATSGPVSRPTPISTPIDRDGDRVPDGSDQCPTQPGSLRDGCPVVDRDGDGISDKYDKCPDVPEVRDGRADGDGCPI